MRKLKRTLAILLAVFLVCTAAPLGSLAGPDLGIHASALDAAGQCGENVYWSFDSATGTLTISGTGKMNDYYSPSGSLFNGNTDIRTVVIEDGVTKIGSHAFYGCTALTSVEIPDSVTSVGYSAFVNCTALTNIYISDIEAWCGIMFYEYDSNPLEYAHKLYLNGTVVTDLVIPDSTASIGSFAFRNCTALTSVTIGSSVASIGDDAFYGCTGLTSVEIPDSVTKIGFNAFYNCTALTSVTFGSGVTEVDWWAFGNCTALTRVNISSMEAWCNISFYDYCSNPLEFAHNLYLNGTLVTDLVIPDSITSLRHSAFIGCTSLTSVTIPDSVTSIDDVAFSGCTALTSITIPGSVTNIGDYVFSNCTALTSVNISSIEAWCNISFGYEGGSNPLEYAHNLYLNGTLVTDLVIPDSVTKIGRDAFSGCTGLTSAAIPGSVTNIYEGAFDGCTSLQDVYYGGSESDWNKITIGSYNECLQNAAIHFAEHVHTYSEWQMVINPTSAHKGRMVRVCTECGETLDEMDVPMLIDNQVTGVTVSTSKLYLNSGETAALTALVQPVTAANRTVLWTSSDPTVATVSDGVITALMPGVAVVIAQTQDCGFKDFCLVQVSAVTAQNGAYVDNTRGVIYGLTCKLDSAEDYLSLADDSMTLSYSSGKIGTGTKINVMRGDTLVNTYEAVIFGDINGDSIYDAQDATIANCIANGLLTREQVGEAKYLAADCNHDGEVNSTDVLILEQAGLLLSQVDQTKEDYAETDAFAEYIDLIDQNPNAEEPVEEPVEQAIAPAPQTFLAKLLGILQKIIIFLRSMFPKI